MNASSEKQLSFREHLPDGCPPISAQSISENTFVYRVLKGVNPEESDFDSQREQHPTKCYPLAEEECAACGVSVWRTLEAARRLQARHKKFRHKSIAQVRLDFESGKIFQSESNPDHFTWWPFESSEILVNCELVSA